MKTAKRLLTAALAVLFTFMCALPAMADDLVNQETYTLTIDNPEAGHTYEAYQIFEGTFSVGTGKNAQGNPVNESYLSDINWGTGVVHEGETGYDVMIKALKEATPTLYDDGETLVAGVNDATKVAVALNNHNNAETADIFNEIVGGHLTGVFATATATADGKMAFDKLAPGYYLVKDKDNSLSEKENESYTKYLVKLVDSTTIEVKSQSMSLDKVIVEDGKEVDANNAAMGETVSYKLTSKTSAMDGYEDYTYIIHDELDGGLTFDGVESMTVTVGDEDYKEHCKVTYSTNGTSYSADNTANPGQKLYIKIELKDLVQNRKSNKDVVVTYTATVNEKASIGNTPNTNTAYLEYSNNPNQSQKNDAPTSKTLKEHVSTYVAGFQISKKSPKGDDLPGAQFMTTGTIKWANTQADRIGARGHVGTHLDCYTTVPEKPEYNITAMVLDCQNEMPKEEDIKSLTTLENMALLLHTANLERNEYGTDMYFSTETFLSEEVLHTILEKKLLSMR